MNIDLSQFYQVFFEEAAEHLTTMESLLLALDVNFPDPDELNAIFRSAHSIKGGSATFGFDDMTRVTHILESQFDRLRKREMKLTGEMVSVFLEAKDVILMQLDGHQKGSPVDEHRVEIICESLTKLTASLNDNHISSPNEATTDDDYGFFDEAPVATTQIDSGYGFFEDLPVIDAESIDDVTDKHVTGEFSPSSGKQTASMSGMVRDRTDAGRIDKSTVVESSIRVNVEKVDQLLNLVGELVITQAMLIESATEIEGVVFEKFQIGLRQLERNTRDIQEVIMSVRMLPISFVFSRFPRMVHDLAGKLGKLVELKMLGEGTELDRGLIEKITDPLTHLVRNSLDHGIETPEIRVANGKPACGTITLKASHQGGSIVVEISDDGAGMNREKILAKAREQGISLPDEITDEQVWMLVFEAGFSTADVVSDISGRGVGLDVVKRNIALLGGRVEVVSVVGEGVRILIRLPLTMAILDGLSVGVGEQIYIIPLAFIIESWLMNPGDMRTISGGGHMLYVRGEYVPVVALHELFPMPRHEAPEPRIVVIVEADGRKIALLVDELIGQHQVVIKSLEANFRKLPGISGATIMGDGMVAMILDVSALCLTPARQNKLLAL
jgi:two-component system chemotaxis sensor kinase CheA